MEASDPDFQSKVQRLEMVIEKGDAIITVLEKTGLDMSAHKARIQEARDSMVQGDFPKAYRLVGGCISDLMALKSNIPKPEEARTPSSQKRGQGVFALIRDNTAEMDKKIAEWKIITSGWREKGYTFEDDETLFGNQFNEVEKRFISIGEMIEKAEMIRASIKSAREEFSFFGRVTRSKLDDIEAAAFRLDKLDDVDRRLKTLVQSFRSVENRIKGLRNRINRYRRKGLSTSSLDEMVDAEEDLDYLEKQFNIYEGNIDFLLKEKVKLASFKEDPTSERFQNRMAEIERMIDDPWMLDQVVEKMLSLEKDILRERESRKRREEEKNRRSEIAKVLERYSAEGFKVETVEQLLDDDINLLEEEYDILIRQTARLKALKEKLFKLDASGFEDEVSSISIKLFDPSNIDIVERELSDLKDRILNQKIRSQKIENSIREWNGRGFKTSKLEAALHTDMDEAERLHSDYKDRIKELSDLETKLKEIGHREVEDRTEKIAMKIKDPEMIETVRKEMAELLKVVAGVDQVKDKRKEINKTLKDWRSQGYRIDQILVSVKEAGTLEDLDKIKVDYTARIAQIEGNKKELPSEMRGWFPELEKYIEENLYDPDRAKDVSTRIAELKEVNRKEERRRGEISRKLKALADNGTDVSSMERSLEGDASTVTQDYEVFRDRVTRLLKLKTALLKEAHRTKDQNMEVMAKGMTDPTKIDEYEKMVAGKKEAPEQGPERTVQRPADNMDSLRELAKKYYRENQLEQALGLFDQVLSMEPDNKESIFFKKKVLLKLRTVPKNASMAEGQSPGPVTSPVENPPPAPIAPPSDAPAPAAPEAKGPDPNCLSCKGTGQCTWCQGKGVCSSCEGTGKVFGASCTNCSGAGKCSVCKGSGKCSWCNL